MSARGGNLSLLAIGTIFLVVFAFIYGGLAYSRGELLADPTTDAEDRLRDAAWEKLGDRRAAEGVEPMPQDSYVRSVAQETTDTLLAQRADEWANGSPDPPLPNRRMYCVQLPVRVSLPNATADGATPRETTAARTEATSTTALATNETADSIVDALEASNENGVLFRPVGRFHAGMGIAIRDDAVYAVYRSCELIDT